MSLAKDLAPLTIEPLWVTIPDEENWWSDEPELETPLHLEQIVLLLTCLQWWWRERERVFIAANISIYYEKQQGRSGSHRARGPDFFVVKDAPERQRNSWMVWKEDNRFPDLIVEILSDSTAKVDRVDKKRLYQNTFKTPEYFWFHPRTLEFAGFRLSGGRYQPLTENEQGWLWSEELQLFLGIYEDRLRFFTPAGDLVPVPTEVAIDAAERQQQAELAAEQAELAAEQAERVAEQERQQRQQAERVAEQAQQKATALEAQLAEYRQRFGDLPSAGKDS